MDIREGGSNVIYLTHLQVALVSFYGRSHALGGGRALCDEEWSSHRQTLPAPQGGSAVQTWFEARCIVTDRYESCCSGVCKVCKILFTVFIV